MTLPDIRYVQIQTHSRCNADCVFCPYIESWHAANHGAMPQALWEKVLENLLPFASGINQGKVCPYFMQEPLIDKTIFKKIEDIYTYFPTTRLELSTNGAALTEKTADRLIETCVGRRHEIWVSHHGIDEASLQLVMKIDYKKAHRNLIYLLKKADGRVRVRIRGAGESRDGRIKYFSREAYLAYWREQFDQHQINTERVDVDAFTFHDRAGTIHRLDREAYKLNLGKVREIGPGHEPFYCRRLDQWVHFTYDGRIRLCCMDYHGEVVLPSINDVSLVDYFQSETYRNLYEMVTGKRESPENFICKRCVSPGG